CLYSYVYFFFQAEDGIRDKLVTGVQTCALPIYLRDRILAQVQQTPSPVRSVVTQRTRILLVLAAVLALAVFLIIGGMHLGSRPEIGRASCRERVWIAVVAGS